MQLATTKDSVFALGVNGRAYYLKADKQGCVFWQPLPAIGKKSAPDEAVAPRDDLPKHAPIGRTKP